MSSVTKLFSKLFTSSTNQATPATPAMTAAAEELNLRPRRVEFAISVLVTLAGLYIYYGTVTSTTANRKLPGSALFSFVQNIELRSLDALFKSRGPRPADPRIVIVGIDETTPRKVGALSLPRDGYPLLVDKLHEGGAKVVAFDVSFPTPEKNSAITALKQLEGEVGPRDPALIAKIRTIEATSDNDRILADS